MYHVVTEIDRLTSICVADLDSDDHLDVIVTSDEWNLIGWCANNGFGTFGDLKVIDDVVNGINTISTTDIDGVGDLDLLSSVVSYEGRGNIPKSMIAWYANDGSGQFSSSRVIATEACEIESVYTVDLDEDGDLDLVFVATGSDTPNVSSPNTTIGWYANDGFGQFAWQQAITSETVEPESVCLTDLDGDDNVDLLAVIDRYDIALFRNNGQGQFDVHQVIGTSTVKINSIRIADLNGDGSLDVLAALDGGFGHPSIAWYANDGSGGIGPSQEIPVGVEPVDGAYAVKATDVDHDGDLDVVAALYSWRRACSVTMTWYVNNGTGQFRFQQIIKQAGEYGAFSNLLTADLDNDDDLDLLGVDLRNDEVLWFENGGLGYGPQVVISTELKSPGDITSVDLDGDSDLDVLTTGGTQGRLIVWYENRGSRRFGAQQLIYEQAPNTIRGGITIYPTDLDGDSDADILSSFRDSNGRYVIHLHRNEGAGTFSLQQVNSPEDYAAPKVLAADLDSDGDLDVIGFGGLVTWYANNGSGQFGPMQVIAAPATEHVSAVDLDGDGDLDIVATLSWYENDGSGQFGPEQVISRDTVGVNCVHAADVDGDGDWDILSAAYKYYTYQNTVRYIAWYENDGSGQFGPRQFISSDVWSVQSIDTADLDEDGDLDILMAAYYEDKIAWFENNGSGQFSDQRVIYERANGARCVHAADLDGDSDMDILSSSSNDDTIALYDNE